MSTSKLQRKVSELLSRNFGDLTIRENIRPEWLISCDGARLELDFYIEELNIAIEVQGQQHYVFTEFMHGNYDGFIKRQEYDQRKRELCNEKSIRLFEVSSDAEAADVIQEIISINRRRIGKKCKYISAPSRKINVDKLTRKQKKLQALNGLTLGLDRMIRSGNCSDEQIAERMAIIRATAKNLYIDTDKNIVLVDQDKQPVNESR